MLGIALLYVGAVLLVNAMMLLGKVSGKGAAPMNFFTGGIALDKPIAKFTGYITLAEAIVTCWLPGYLLLVGYW